MATVIEVNVQEIEKRAQKLNAYSLTPVQQRRLLKGLGLEGEEQTKDRFDTKRDPEGRRWRDISAAYRTFLSRHYSGAQPPLGKQEHLCSFPFLGTMCTLVQ